MGTEDDERVQLRVWRWAQERIARHTALARQDREAEAEELEALYAWLRHVPGAKPPAPDADWRLLDRPAFRCRPAPSDRPPAVPDPLWD